MGNKIAASFRDPSGVVYSHNGKLLRQINKVYQQDYDLLLSSGLYDRLSKKKLLVSHEESQEPPLLPELAYKIIQPEKIDFISYPYEWSFSQLKDAALLTLNIEKEALNSGLSLKDASAYNIQFHHGAPILIDTLSFCQYQEGQPWVAYKQFCQHFLAPLALMSKTDLQLSKLLIHYIDGIPLALCSKLLPGSTRLSFGLTSHIHLHAQAENRYAATGDDAGRNLSEKKPQVSKIGLLGILDSLEKTVRSLNIQAAGKEWANYYSNTNYTDDSFKSKKQIVKEWSQALKPKKVMDLGANTGVFSREAAWSPDCLVISSDIDPEAVEANYLQIKVDAQKNVLPLVIDLTNPSPAIGWDNQERESFYQRGQCDLVLALALIHHLAIANNVPLLDIAHTFSELGTYLLLEFVPKEDSQVKRLLRSRDDIFSDYSLEGILNAFSAFYQLEKQTPVPGSARTMLLFKRK